MTALKQVLEKNLIDNYCLTITIICHIPKLTLRIIDSRQMILYGIGQNRKQGFTLYMRVDKNSNKAKKLNQELNANNLLTGFKKFEEERSIIYVRDFETETDLITEQLHNTLHKLNGQPYEFDIKRTDGNSLLTE